MHRFTKLALAALVFTFVLALGAGTASANRSLSLDPAGGVQASSRLTLRGTEGGGATVICDITLLRTISRVIPKINGTLMGKVTGIRIARETCSASTGGEVTVTPQCATQTAERSLWTANECGELWRLSYEGFEGTLPRITGIRKRIRGVQFLVLIDIFFARISCLYNGDAFARINVREGRITEGRASEELINLTRVSGPETCPGPGGTFAGTFAVTPTQTVTLL